MQPVLILFGAALTLVTSFALGSVLLGEDCVDAGTRTATGTALLSTAVFGCCAAGLAYGIVFVAITICFLAIAYRNRTYYFKFSLGRQWWLLAAPFFLLYLSNAMAPEVSFDGSRYHLGLVSAYLRGHGFHPILDNLYAAFPAGVEMLYLFAFAFGQHSAAALVHFGLLLALCWQMISWGERNGAPLAGVAGALLVFLSPLAGVDGSSAYNDVAVAAIAFTLFYLLQIWEERRSARLLVAVGMMAGFAYAAKYTAFLAVPYAMAAVGRKSRRWREPAVVGLAAGLVMAPWLIRNWLWFHNPVAPFFNHWFPNEYITSSFENSYRIQISHPNLRGIWQIPLEVTAFGSLSGLLGPVFLLSPLALLALGARQGRELLLAAAIFGLGFGGNVSARFLIPALPFVALAMGLVLARWPRIAFAVVAVHAVLSWPPVLRAYAHVDAWHLNKVTWREALRIKPEDGFLESNLPLYGAARLLERATAPGAVVFAQTPIPEAYTTRHVRTAYQSAANIVSRDILWSGFMPEQAPTRLLEFRFARQHLTGIRLRQEGAGDGQWRINEIRLFDGGHELERGGWRATARPFPWGIEAALDGRAASFWMCGDDLTRGQEVEIEFRREADVDEVRIETVPDPAAERLRLEGRPAGYGWIPLAGAPLAADLTIPADFRRRAAEELRRRGNDFLLVLDGEFGAGDLRAHAADWGVRLVGEYKGARLYRLP